MVSNDEEGKQKYTLFVRFSASLSRLHLAVARSPKLVVGGSNTIGQ